MWTNATGNLMLVPMMRKWGGVFSAFQEGADKGHEDVVLPAGCTDAELGAGMRLALSRCL